MLRKFAGRHVILLQGPAGPFFRRIAAALDEVRATHTKVNFNGGDAAFFSGPHAVSYRGTLEDWPTFFRNLARRVDATDVFVFGDMRPLHARAIAVARELGIRIYVFEEGYLRPDYVTFEADGVNGNSRLPRDPGFYRSLNVPEVPTPEPVGNTFWASAWWSILYALATAFGWPAFPKYQHHRPLNVGYQIYAQCRGAVRWLVFRIRERNVLEQLVEHRSGQFYFVPLQVYCDFQLRHSDYADVRDFIREVVDSFARHAPASTSLVIKHHPMDRSFRDYSRFLRELSTAHGLGERLVYVHDLHLPTLLRHAKGTIVINSTVGISSLQHGTPVKVMGWAIYDMLGLTHQGTLESFWTHAEPVDHGLFKNFRGWIAHHTQLNGSVWKALPGTAGGLRGSASTGESGEFRLRGEGDRLGDPSPDLGR